MNLVESNFSKFKEKLSEVLIEKIDPISKEIKKIIRMMRNTWIRNSIRRI